MEDEGSGLGKLCQLTAEEMREGLENGLSVKLTQVYLYFLPGTRFRIVCASRCTRGGWEGYAAQIDKCLPGKPLKRLFFWETGGGLE